MAAQLFEMSDDDRDQLLKNIRSSLIQGVFSLVALGKKMGFDPLTVKAAPGKGPEFIYAEPVKISKEVQAGQQRYKQVNTGANRSIAVQTRRQLSGIPG